MLSSIPATIYPNFSSPPHLPSSSTLLVGHAEKDFPEGSDTVMKKSVALAAEKAQAKFDAEMAQYNVDLPQAERKALAAKQEMDVVKRKHAIATTLLVLSIISVVGIAIATSVTGILPLLFAAIPFVGGIAYFSAIVDMSNNRAWQLTHDVNAPRRLLRPHLNLPIYRPEKDLDLEKSRHDAQNALASASLEQVANSGWDKQQLTGYALLDRAAPIAKEERPTFYGKCLHLIEAYGNLLAERSNYYDRANNEKDRLVSELSQWKSQQDDHIRAQETVIYQPHTHIGYQARIRHGNLRVQPTVRVTPGVTFRSRWQIDNMRAEVESQYARRDSEIYNWYHSTNNAIDISFKNAVAQLEHKFQQLKISPAAVQ